MNLEKRISEKEYRKLDKLSYSSIKEFDKDRMSFYKRFVLREPYKEKDSDDMTRGRVTETLLWESERFDERFYISSVEDIPAETTNMHKFVKVLARKTEESCDGEGVVCRDLREMMEETYLEVGIKKPGFELFIEGFVGSSAEDWYNELRMANCYTVISMDMVNNCERNKVMLEPLIKNEVGRNKMEVQVPYEWEDDGLELKMMIDMLVLDSRNKVARPYDLKSTWELENFSRNYLSNKYYLQGANYDKGLKNMLGKEWTIEPMTFIACDSTSRLKPLLCPMSRTDLDKAYNGFRIGGKAYKGLNQLLMEIAWHKNNGIWDICMEAHQNSGKKLLGIKYE